jgi:hypothetical protein
LHRKHLAFLPGRARSRHGHHLRERHHQSGAAQAHPQGFEDGDQLEGGGFSDVEVEETEVSFEWESADEFVAMVKDTFPPLVALIAKHAPDDPDRVWDAILGAVKERASDDGTVTFSNLVLLAVGRA